MAAYVSPNLLASYLATAARQALSGEALTERSLWAIDNARQQLQEDRDVLAGVKSVTESSAIRAAVPSGPSGATPSLTALVLGNDDDAPQASSLEDHEKRAIDRLGKVMEDLELLAGDEPDLRAARRIAAAVARPDRVAA